MTTKEAYVNIKKQTGIGIIEFFHPQSNSLPSHLLNKLAETINEAGNDDSINVIILKSGGDRTFCAGASFDELISINNLLLSSPLISESSQLASPSNILFTSLPVGTMVITTSELCARLWRPLAARAPNSSTKLSTASRFKSKTIISRTAERRSKNGPAETGTTQPDSHGTIDIGEGGTL